MKVYLDLIIFINIMFDFIILLSVSIILKRKNNLFRVILGTLFGSVTLITLLINLNIILLFLFKLLVSSIMVLISFSFVNIRYFIKNLYYFYMVSILLGGLLFFINNQFLNNDGLIFYSNFRINIIVSILLSLLLLFIYIKNIKILKTNNNKYLKIKLFINNYKLDLISFLDTGNKLIDPYTFKPIILVDKKYIKEKDNYILVPFKSCNNSGLLKCIKADKLIIEGIGERNNFLVGLSDSISIDGVDCLLNEKLLEG